MVPRLSPEDVTAETVVAVSQAVSHLLTRLPGRRHQEAFTAITADEVGVCVQGQVLAVTAACNRESLCAHHWAGRQKDKE